MSKNSAVDTLIAYLHSLRGGEHIDDLALAKVRFVEQILRESELTSVEKDRAVVALAVAYTVVHPNYVKSQRVFLEEFGYKLSAETEEALHALPNIPHGLDMVYVGDSASDVAIKNFVNRKKM